MEIMQLIPWSPVVALALMVTGLIVTFWVIRGGYRLRLRQRRFELLIEPNQPKQK
jgi:hypothetical protein